MIFDYLETMNLSRFWKFWGKVKSGNSGKLLGTLAYMVVVLIVGVIQKSLVSKCHCSLCCCQGIKQ